MASQRATRKVDSPLRVKESPKNRPSLKGIFEKRLQIVKEIVDSEFAFVNSIDAMEELLMIPLKAVFPQALHTAVFSNILSLRDLNKKFANDLMQRYETWDEQQRLGDLFLEFAPFFKMYTTYVNNHERIGPLLQQLNHHKKYKAFQRFEQEQRKLARLKKQRLVDFLIMPVQRIPRYKMLLSRLQRHTDKSHPDYELLSKAIEKVEVVAHNINESVRASENRQITLGIQNKFSDQTFIAPHRLFVVSGTLLQRTAKTAETPFKFFLFTDMLVWARQRSQGSKYELAGKVLIDETFDIERMKLYVGPNGQASSGNLMAGLTSNGQSSSGNLMAGLASSGGAAVAGAIAGTLVTTSCVKVIHGQQSFLIRAEKQKATDHWYAALSKCVEERRKTQQGQLKHRRRSSLVLTAVYEPKDTAIACTLCGIDFGVLRRKYNCKRCGAVVCSDCSKARLMVEALQKRVRVCAPCVESVHEDMLTVAAEQSSRNLAASSIVTITPEDKATEASQEAGVERKEDTAPSSTADDSQSQNSDTLMLEDTDNDIISSNSTSVFDGNENYGGLGDDVKDLLQMDPLSEADFSMMRDATKFEEAIRRAFRR